MLRSTCDAAILLDQLHGVVEHGERGQAQEIHLQQADVLEALHVVLRRDFIPVGLVQRDDVGERLAEKSPRRRRAWRRDAPGLPGAWRLPSDPCSARRSRSRLCSCGDCFSASSSVMLSWSGTSLAMRSTSPYGMSMARPTSLIAAFAAMVPKVMICATFDAAIFSGDVLDHFAAAPHAEIDVDVGHRHAFGIQEALEQQIVLQRIDVRDLQRVADQAARRRTASRAHGNSLRPRVANEIPDDQEISRRSASAGSSGFRRSGAFRIRPAFCAGALLGARLQDRNARGKSFAHDCFKIAVDGVAFRNLEIRKRILHRVDFHVAALGDRHGAFERFGNFAEHLRHFFRGLEDKTGRWQISCGACRSWSCRSECTAGLPARERRRASDSGNRWWRPAEFRFPCERLHDFAD